MAVDLSKTHFDLFDLPVVFGVDIEKLNDRYRELAAAVHPDRFASGTDQERRVSMQHATQINEAYQTLKDPLRRGRYMLELGGYEFNDEHHTTRDTAFLMEQMELREHLDEVRDADDPLGGIGKLLQDLENRFDELAAELAGLLENDSSDSRESAADLLMKMQFFRKLQDESQELEAELEDQIDF